MTTTARWTRSPAANLPAKIWRDFVTEAEKILAEPTAAPAIGSSASPATPVKAVAAGR